MLYNSYKELKSRTGRFPPGKRMLLAILLCGTLIILSSCTLLTKPLDSRTGFSQHLAQAEHNIRKENWTQARTSLDDAEKAWRKLKPLIQVDVDHDYVKDIEDGFTKLDGYLATKDLSNSLVSILLIENTWENIGSL